MAMAWSLVPRFRSSCRRFAIVADHDAKTAAFSSWISWLVASLRRAVRDSNGCVENVA